MAVCLLAGFGLWTAAVRMMDVQPIGPGGSVVGFAALNSFVHQLTGVHMLLYSMTDWLSLVPVGFAMGFALLGLGQWIRRRQILEVDHSILVLGAFYLVVMALYVFFEVVVINRRPVLIDGILEASYPSSTTLLVLCIMPTAAMQLYQRIKKGAFRQGIMLAMAVYTVLMIVGRLVSGVHWFTDIVGGVLLSTGLVMLYRAICSLIEE